MSSDQSTKPRFDTASPPLSELPQRARDETQCKTCIADREFKHKNGKYYCSNCPMFWEWSKPNGKKLGAS